MVHAHQLIGTRAADDSWIAGIQELDADERVRALEIADGLRTRDPASVRKALLVYRALAAELDPTDEHDCGRILWLLRRSRPNDRALRGLAQEAVEHAMDPRVRFRARLRLARLEDYDGRPDVAESYLHAAVCEVRGTGAAEEEAAYYHLARFAIRHGRHFEAMFLLMRVRALAEANGNACGLVMAGCALSDVLCSLDDFDRSTAELDQVEVRLADLGPEDRPSAESQFFACRIRAAWLRHDFGLARELIAQAGDTGGDGLQSEWLDFIRGATAVDEGRLEEALELIDEGQARVAEHAPTWFRFELDRIRCVARLEGPEAGAARAAAALDLLEGAMRARLGPYRLLRFAVECARTCLDDCRDTLLSRRAFELATAAAIERLVEIDRCTVDFPEVAEIAAQETGIVTEYHDRWMREQHELLDRVATVLEDAARTEGASLLTRLISEDSLVRVCAWCRRVRTRGGRWLPVVDFLPEGRVEVTHGVCGDCREGILAAGHMPASPR